MSTTIGGLTIPSGWVSANDDNFITWKGQQYNGITESNVGGKLGLTFANSFDYTNFELCEYVKIVTNDVGVSGTYKVLSGTFTSGTYTVVIDRPFISITNSWTITFLWDMKSQMWGGFIGSQNVQTNYVEANLIVDVSVQEANLNLREYLRHFFTYDPYVNPYTSGVLTGSVYDRILYRHIVLNFQGVGRFAQFLTANSIDAETYLAFYPLGNIFNCLNSGYTNQGIVKFLLGERPISDYAPFDDCNSLNLHSYINGNHVITVSSGQLPYGVGFDKIDIDLIVY